MTVLILVLVEYALWDSVEFPQEPKYTVLILVLVEYALWDGLSMCFVMKTGGKS